MSDCSNVQKVFVPLDKDKQASLAEQPVVKSGIGITDKAAEKILYFCQQTGKNPEEHGLKVSVVKDGCSGNSYVMDIASIAESKEAGDKFFVHNGATVMVEKLSYMFVIGSDVDYVETLLMSGFQMVNPNIKKTCSCGSSFSVKG
jgi:iron-sulfur cluster assembly accessory protein